MKLLFSIMVLFCVTARSAVEYRDITLSDGDVIQTCTRYPDSKKFPGPRPTIMLIMGSGLYDSCRSKTATGDFSDQIVEKGVALFLRQKRGVRHDPSTDTFTTDLAQYKQADLPHLKSDTLEALEFLLADTRVDRTRISVWGGSEGTLLATHLGLHHPELREVVLASSMIESFPSLFARQMYEILPRQLIEMFDKNSDKVLNVQEMSNQFLADSGLDSFSKVDFNNDGLLDTREISDEVKQVIAASLATDLPGPLNSLE